MLIIGTSEPDLRVRNQRTQEYALEKSGKWKDRVENMSFPSHDTTPDTKHGICLVRSHIAWYAVLK